MAAKKAAIKQEEIKQESKSSKVIAKEDFLWFKRGEEVKGEEEHIAKWKEQGLVE